MEDDSGSDDGSATRRGRFRVSAPPAGPPETTVGRFRLVPQGGNYGPASPFLQRGRFSVIPEEPQNSPSATMTPPIIVTDRQASPDWDFDDDKDSADGGSNFQRPSTAPAASSDSTRSSKRQKKSERDAKKQEKEQKKIERETARRLEREAAKLEKLNRKHENISRSTERVSGGRSGSLERRRSGDEGPVLNQSTVHGIASPNRRPTIFDVFRTRKGSDSKKKKDDSSKSGSDKDSTSGSGTIPGGSGGIMNSMKAALHVGGRHSHQTGTTQPASSTATTKVRDGSAHPHAGSDAQYYHTVTAVRRADAGKSPMTKVMDLFRHRSNSAVSEADKRKAVSNSRLDSEMMMHHRHHHHVTRLGGMFVVARAFNSAEQPSNGATFEHR